ncbi:MAG: hypothetical protein HY341_01515 [Candidatus Kerfeldbacteria bacterium]|nr:hypothetical protein [Candidatus Kerfeldbacteria bacterium]
MESIRRIVRDHRGLLPREILLLSIIIVVFAAATVIALRLEHAKTRDTQRLSDMRVVQRAFERLWLETASFQGAAADGCSETGMAVSQCNLFAYEPAIAQLRDPGQYAYAVTQVPGSDTYEVSFTLEQSYGALASGRHTLTPRGIE